MGHYLLLLVAGLSIAGITYRATMATSDVQSTSSQASSEDLSLARSAAQSGFDVALGEMSRDLNARPAATNRTVSAGGTAGTYTLTTTTNGTGTLEVVSRGRFRNQSHVIEAEVLELLPMGAGIVVHGKEAKIEIKKGGTVSGHDMRAPSTGHLSGGPAPSRPAIGFTDAGVMTQVKNKDKIDAGSLAGAAEMSVIAPPGQANQIAIAVTESASALRYKDLKLDDETLGSPTAPVMVHVTKKAELKKGAVGYGVLVVDGDLKIEKGSRWEGLIIVRATDKKKRKVELKDDAHITGGLVLLGAEYETESDGDAGFVGGHMDLDIFEGSGIPLDRSYHQHEWDDKNDLTYLDFFTAPDLADSFDALHRGHSPKTYRVEFMNVHNATGTYRIETGSSVWTGRIEDGLDLPSVDFKHLKAFRVDFDALCALRGSNPGRVKSDGVDRDGSFTVRFWEKGTLVYAVSAYEHAKSLRDGDPSCGAPASAGGPPAVDTDLYGEFEVKIEKDSAVQYSEEAMGWAGRTVPIVRQQSRTLPVLMRSVPTSH